MRRFIETMVIGAVLGMILLAGGRLVLGIDPSIGEIILVVILCAMWDEVYGWAYDRELQRRWVSRNRKER